MIEVTHDQETSGWPAESCCFCKTPTHYWHTPKDVAVCQSCAATHDVSALPSKREWLNANRKQGQELLPPGWRCHAESRAMENLTLKG